MGLNNGELFNDLVKPDNFSIFIINIDKSKKRLIYDQENLYLALSGMNKTFQKINL